MEFFRILFSRWSREIGILTHTLTGLKKCCVGRATVFTVGYTYSMFSLEVVWLC